VQDVTVVRSAATTVLPGQDLSLYTGCQAGDVAFSGGFELGGDVPVLGSLHVLHDEPVTGRATTVPTGWRVGIRNGAVETPATLTVFVVCGAVGGTATS
jgi:hypothetical protein